MRTVSLGVVLACGALAAPQAAPQFRPSKPPPRAFAAGLKTIQERDAVALLRQLAGPDYMGRGIRQPGYLLSAGFVAAWLRQHGIEPAGENGSYFQKVTAELVSVNASTATLDLVDNQALKYGIEVAWAAVKDLEVEVPFAFVRFAKDGTPPSLDGLEGRHVIVYPTPPPEQRAQSVAFQSQARTRGIAFTFPTANLNVPQAQTLILENPPEGDRPTTINLTLTGAARIGELVGLPSDPEPTDHPQVWKSEFPLKIKSRLTRTPAWTSVNVLGKITGTDPRLRNEAVLIGAHLDHMGETNRGVLYGADDNASGVTANMLIARAFAANPAKPKRTVAFCFWTAEESGLLGSARYVRNPIVPPENMVAYLNMDMVGRNSNYTRWNDFAEDNVDAVYISAAKINSPDLHRVLVQANQHVGLRLREDKEERSNRSDTGSFLRVKVPTLKAFTGEHEDYHQPTDTPDKINFPKLTAVAKWLYLASQDLASAPGRPAYIGTRQLVTGTLELQNPPRLGPRDEVHLKLVEVSSDGKRKVIDDQVMTRPGQFPIQFGMVFDPARFSAGATHVIEAEVRRHGTRDVIRKEHPVSLNPPPRNRVRISMGTARAESPPPQESPQD